MMLSPRRRSWPGESAALPEPPSSGRGAAVCGGSGWPRARGASAASARTRPATEPRVGSMRLALMIAPAMARAGRKTLTHFDSRGSAHMVDVGAKAATRRIAVASGRIAMQPATFRLVAAGRAKKGDVLGVARIAAIQAAKRTPDLIPLAHPIALTRVGVEFDLQK